ncbi:MAG: hypothetical protein P1V36_00030 [Planctomycetota bacterium]|nr:hypothetical protein [Planctomycetota bacterium]
MKVAFYGGRHLNNVQALYEAWYQLDDVSWVITTDEPGGPSIIASITRSAGVPTTKLEAAWLLHGDLAERMRRYAIMKAEPDMIALMPGGADVEEMLAIADAARVPVWDLRDIEYIKLGDARQLGGYELDLADLPF